jgi:hypothetical protein
MYVRTRPRDGVRVVVTEAEADRIKADWIAYSEEREDAHIATIQKQLAETKASNLAVFKKIGVKTIKCYAAPNGTVCAECRKRDGAIIKIDDAKIGATLPPFSKCLNTDIKQCGRRGCRCDWIAWDMSLL